MPHISVAQFSSGKNVCRLISVPTLYDVLSPSELTTKCILDLEDSITVVKGLSGPVPKSVLLVITCFA